MKFGIIISTVMSLFRVFSVSPPEFWLQPDVHHSRTDDIGLRGRRPGLAPAPLDFILPCPD